MRLLIDGLIAVMLLGVLVGVAVYHRQAQWETDRYSDTLEALGDIHERALYHAALENATSEDAVPSSYPRLLRPEWFSEGVPLNPLAGRSHAWADVAPEDDTGDHPPDPVLHRPGQAGFWYNPARGVIRARVPNQVTERQTLDLYNRLNGTSLASLPTDPDPARTPHVPQGMEWSPPPRPQAVPVAAATPDEPAPAKEAEPERPQGPSLLRVRDNARP